jgi:hypothetical protein
MELKMKQFVYIAFFNDKAIGTGILNKQRESAVMSSLHKIYGKPKQGFSFIVHEMTR